MRAFSVPAIGAAPRLVTARLPDPGPGEIRVRIGACGLNFADLLMMKGEYQDTPEAPFTLGMEAAGVVEALGPGVAAPAVPGAGRAREQTRSPRRPARHRRPSGEARRRPRGLPRPGGCPRRPHR